MLKKGKSNESNTKSKKALKGAPKAVQARRIPKRAPGTEKEKNRIKVPQIARQEGVDWIRLPHRHRMAWGPASLWR
jgi:hypothetical protein